MSDSIKNLKNAMNSELSLVDEGDGYNLYHSMLVKQHQQEFISDSHKAHERYKTVFKDNNLDCTLGYKFYNIFSLTVGSPLFYLLYRQISLAVRSIVNDTDPLWMQCWLNYHKSNEVLNWHGHYGCILHGYISIDPKNTTTEFKKFSIKNEVGLMYIGSPSTQHRVVVNEDYSDTRLTLAFDVADLSLNMQSKDQRVRHNLSFIPVP